MSAEPQPPSSAGLLELATAEGAGAYQGAETPSISPELIASIKRFQAALAVVLSRLTAFDRLAIVVAVGLATSMEVGVTTSVNVILPDMQGNVGASADEMSWVITVYSAAFLSALPLNTTLARIMGHRNHLLLSLALYTLGAVGCCLSHDLTALLTARAFMGFGGGGFLVRSQATVYRLFQGKQRGRSMLIFGTVLCLSKAALPYLFGEIAEHSTWNYAFLVPVPMALVAATLLFLFVPRRLELFQDHAKPDLAAVLFLVCGITAFQIFISRGEQDGWLASTHLCVAAAIALVALAGFVARDLRRNNPNPLLHLRLLASQHAFSSSLGIAFILGSVLGSGLYLLPQYLRNIEGYSSGQTGLFFAVDGLATLVGTFLAGLLLPKLNIRIVLLIAFSLFLVGNTGFVSILTAETPAWIIGSLLLLHGASVGILLVSVGSFVMGGVDLRLISFGASIYIFFRQVGNTIGVTATVILIDLRESLHSGRLLDTANRASPLLRSFTQELITRSHRLGFGAVRTAGVADQTFGNLVSIQSRLLSYIDVFWSLQILAILGALLLIPGSGLIRSLPKPASQR